MPRNNYFDLYPTVIYRRPSFFQNVYILSLESVANTFALGETVSTSSMTGQYIGIDERNDMVIKLISGNARNNLILTGELSGSKANILAIAAAPQTALNYSVNMTSLLVRFDIADRIRNISTLFYPYLWRDTDRPDTLADAYYGDPSYHWILMNSVGAADLYHDFPLQGDKFNNFLLAKYKDLTIQAFSITDWDLLNLDQRITHVYAYLSSVIGERNFSFADRPDIKYSCDEDTYNYYRYPTLITVSGLTQIEGTFTKGETVYVGSSLLLSSFNAIYLKNDVLGRMVFAVTSGSLNVSDVLIGNESGAQASFTISSASVPLRSYLDEKNDAAMLTPSVSLPNAMTETKTLTQIEFDRNEAKRLVSVIDNDYTSIIVKNFNAQMSQIRSQRQALGDI